jgi:methionine synthase I (cobalamin-dependent)
VLGNVGPLGDFLSLRGRLSACERRACFCAQIAALQAAGADAILIETMSDPVEMEIAVKAAKESAEGPVFATYAFKKDKDGFRTLTRAPLAEAVQRALAAGADAVGANCGVALSLAENLELARKLVRAAGSTPVILQPNAGSPQWSKNGFRYAATPEAMSDLARLLLEAGVRLIGGCCGTTPLHLAAMSRALH